MTTETEMNKEIWKHYSWKHDEDSYFMINAMLNKARQQGEINLAKKVIIHYFKKIKKDGKKTASNLDIIMATGLDGEIVNIIMNEWEKQKLIIEANKG